MSNYHFYYDESEHSRAITQKTISADGFYDGFVVAIAGWKEEREPAIKERYLRFEKEFLSPNAKELKSTSIKPSQLQFGFASLNKRNLALIEGLLNILDEQTLLHYSFTSKAEYLVRQLFASPQNFQFLDSESAIYSITKALVQYRPDSVLKSLNKRPEDYFDAIRSFLIERIKTDRLNEELKSSEIESLSVALNTTRTTDPPRTTKWDYTMPLEGFSAYLEERGIDSYILTIDQEELTANTAIAMGFHSVREEDSKHCFGIRIADMISGIICKLMKAISNNLKYTDEKSTIEKRLLDERWFIIDERRLALYKSLRRVLKENDRSCFKAYAGSHSDDLVLLISLLDHFNEYESAKDLSKHQGKHGDLFNTLACQELCEHFNKMGWQCAPLFSREEITSNPIRNNSSLPQEPPILPTSSQPMVYQVLYTTIDSALGIPLIATKERSGAFFYKLPVELTGWAKSLASAKDLLLPSMVQFQIVDGICRADIL